MIDSLYDFLFMHSDHGSTVYPLVFETLTTEVFFYIKDVLATCGNTGHTTKVMGWVTDFWQANHRSTSPSHPRPNQPPTISGTGNEYRSNCGDALRLGLKGR